VRRSVAALPGRILSRPGNGLAAGYQRVPAVVARGVTIVG
jgi:hypothetical protein